MQFLCSYQYISLLLYCYIADFFGILKGICGASEAECRKLLFVGGRKEVEQPSMRPGPALEDGQGGHDIDIPCHPSIIDCGGKYPLIWTQFVAIFVLKP